MHIAYQKIVRLSENESECGVVGYEALARFENGESPEHAFKQAWREGNGVELEVEAMEMAVKNFPPTIDEAYLAINASAKTVIAMRGALVKDPGLEIPWPRIVIELSEKDEVVDYQLLDQPLALLVQHKTRIAIDDLGIGFSGLRLMMQTQPDILKIERTFITHIDENHAKRNIVRGIVSMAKGFRAVVVAEGIETVEEKKWCLGLGVDCGQGYFFGKPEPFA